MQLRVGPGKKIDVGLASLFLDHLSEAARQQVSAHPGLEALLEGIVNSGKAAWPDVEADPEALVGHLAERLSDGGEPQVLEALTALHATDFYLAFACAQGDARALDALETHFLSDLSRHLGRADVLRGFADEVKQELRMRLLVRHDGDVLPRIASYRGRGPLGGWLRIAVVRLAVKLRRAAAGRDDADREPRRLDEKAPRDPELGYLKNHYRAELEQALRAALDGLSPREASLLRLYFLENLSTEALASMYRTSLRSVQRWILEARQKVLDETRRALADRAGLASSQLDSVMQLAESQIDISLHEHLTK